MQIIIDIPDDVYKALKEDIYPIPNTERMAIVFKALVNKGIVLPKNVTNGDMINALFPNLEQDRERLIQQYGSQSLYNTYEKWCSLPYKEK